MMFWSASSRPLSPGLKARCASVNLPFIHLAAFHPLRSRRTPDWTQHHWQAGTSGNINALRGYTKVCHLPNFYIPTELVLPVSQNQLEEKLF